jgi:GNAT superfamily N-acetyltransferase
VIGVGRYEPTDDPTTAEVAFVVEDRWQNKGLGTALFTELLRAGVDRGIRRFRADVLADNQRMLDLIDRFGRVESRSLGAGIVSLVFAPRPASRSEDAGAVAGIGDQGS